jgi:formamidopyrimidine-DNA glycosylase
MPELAEVEFYRKRWALAATGETLSSVQTHPKARIFRGVDVGRLEDGLREKKFVSSSAAAKQMLFRFGREAWLGIHLGMSGELFVEAPDYLSRRHDHLVLATAKHTLVFSDPRMFGRVQFHLGKKAPTWWSDIAPAILSSHFTVSPVQLFLRRRARAPIKAVLLMQERFPGVGNWMADEILWRAGIHPKRSAGSLQPAEVRTLWRECRHVCRLALDAIAGRGRKIPADLNIGIPDTWLFKHRWRKGGHCPRTGAPLMHGIVGGRTTCWSPARQKLD